MDRGALIGGAAVVAALAGVVGFYFVLSSGSTGDVADYDREKPSVEKLEAKDRTEAMAARGRNASVKSGHQEEEEGKPMIGKPRPFDAAKAADWRGKRAAALEQETERVGEEVQSFMREIRLPEDRQKDLMSVFDENLEARAEVKVQIEEGAISPREGRTMMAEQREAMKGQLLDRLDPDQYENLRARMDKVKVSLF